MRMNLRCPRRSEHLPAPRPRSPVAHLDPAARRRLGLALAALAALLLWDSAPLLPLRILVVVFHEAGHAATALLTGGEVVAMSVSPDEGGYTLTRGGSRFLVLNGGYLGSLLAGLLLLRLSRQDGRGRVVLAGLGVVLGLAALAWFRPLLSFGFAYAALTAAAFVGLSTRASHGLADWIVRFVGLFSVLYALLDIRSDVLAHGLAAGSVQSDAAMLAELTGVPTLVWGAAWLLVGGALVYRLRRQVF